LLLLLLLLKTTDCPPDGPTETPLAHTGAWYGCGVMTFIPLGCPPDGPTTTPLAHTGG